MQLERPVQLRQRSLVPASHEIRPGEGQIARGADRIQLEPPFRLADRFLSPSHRDEIGDIVIGVAGSPELTSPFVRRAGLLPVPVEPETDRPERRMRLRESRIESERPQHLFPGVDDMTSEQRFSPVGIPIADLCAGIFCAYGIAVALIEREKSGKGQWVKSSLLQALSNVQIKTGDYAFTTTRPVAALTRIRGVLVQLVEIPGLIEGAHEDRGGGRALLGVLRTADAMVLCHVSGAPMDEVATVRNELAAAGIALPAFVAATKADHIHHESHDRLQAIARRLTDRALKRADFSGAEVDVLAMAGVRATREGTARQGKDELPVIIGTPIEGERIAGDSDERRGLE